MTKLNDMRDEVIMQSLTLAKSHTNWKTGKGSMRAFSRQKTMLYNMLTELIEAAINASRVLVDKK